MSTVIRIGPAWLATCTYAVVVPRWSLATVSRWERTAEGAGSPTSPGTSILNVVPVASRRTMRGALRISDSAAAGSSVEKKSRLPPAILRSVLSDRRTHGCTALSGDVRVPHQVATGPIDEPQRRLLARRVHVLNSCQAAVEPFRLEVVVDELLGLDGDVTALEEVGLFAVRAHGRADDGQNGRPRGISRPACLRRGQEPGIEERRGTHRTEKPGRPHRCQQ